MRASRPVHATWSVAPFFYFFIFKVGAYERLRDEPAGELCEERLWVQTLQNHPLRLL